MILLSGLAFVWPAFEVRPYATVRRPVLITLTDLPEIHQIQRPPPPVRPAVPIEIKGEELPDDVTIAATELDFDEIPLPLPDPLPPIDPPAEEEYTSLIDMEEIVDSEQLEIPMEAIYIVKPRYPEVARRAGIEGTVVLEFVIGEDGRVQDAAFLEGGEIFKWISLQAVKQFVFKPAIHRGRPVKVRMLQTIVFKLE